MKIRLCLITLMGGSLMSANGWAGEIHFARDIRPILSDRCFFCHGPDPATREGGLRLDVREAAILAPEGKGSRAAIVPGHPENSEILMRMLSPHDDERMPPPKSKLEVTPEEIALIREWIQQGADYQPHWSYVPLPEEVPVPASGWEAAKTPIDHFVAAKWSSAELAPAPPAPAWKVLRRAAYALTGLPPPTEWHLPDDAPAADIAARIEELFLQPTHGEHMAVHWLDLARYADSYGYQSDLLMNVFPYRDWVVKAFNENMPYDQFLTNQLAGDLLPDTTREQRLATAFNRLHRQTNEGGTVHEEARTEYVADRVHTFGTTFIGMTLECARCHDHKYDPISAREYYQFFAFFNSIDEQGVYLDSRIIPTPTLLLPNEAQERALQDARKTFEAATQTYRERLAGVPDAFEAWMYAWDGSLEFAGGTGVFSLDDWKDNKYANDIKGSPLQITRGGSPEIIEGRKGKAVRFDGDNALHLGAVAAGKENPERADPFSFAFYLRDHEREKEPVVILQRTAGTDVGYHGHELLIADGHLHARLVRHWPGNAIAVKTRNPIPQSEWTHVVWTYDGSSQAAGLTLYVNGRKAELEVVRDRLWKHLDGGGAHSRKHWILGSRWRDKGFRGGDVDEVHSFSREISALEAAVLADPELPGRIVADKSAHRDLLLDHYRIAVDADVAAARTALHKTVTALAAAEQPVYEIAVMEDMPEPRPAYLLDRGLYDAPKTEENRVARGVTESIFPWQEGLPTNRLGLAQWLTHPAHPLTARVAVNRLWASVFGRGIVATPDNFGLQGAWPTHPELLDWLAREYIRSGWDTRHMLRLMLSSAVFQMESAVSLETRERDPENVMLGRGPVRRLTAEMIRDTALATSGLLNPTMGGPPVSPYQPGGDLWREANTMSPAYRQSVGKDLYRRSLYSVWKRTAPLPNMTAFDAGAREMCIAGRPATSTPLQALVLLNDVQFVEAARAAAQRVLANAQLDDAARIKHLFHALTGRPPEPREAALLQELLDSEFARFAADSEAASALLKVGSAAAPADLPPARVAALTLVASTIMNLDATILLR